MSRVRDLASILTASSSIATDAEIPSQVAGKNKVINGDFYWNQRNFTSTSTSNTFGFDRWALEGQGGTITYSSQTFTPGTAPVVGYEGTNFARLVTVSQSANADYAALWQRIEDVRTFANQTITVSFWAKTTSGSPKVTIGFYQGFGSGGSAASVVNVGTQSETLSISWTRYRFTVNIPSVAGKIIGSGSFLNLYLFTSGGPGIVGNGYNVPGIQNTTIDFWGVQAELGTIATPFTTSTGSIQGELSACQRYYWQGSGFQQAGGTSPASNENSIFMPINSFNAVPMRATPTPSIIGTSYITDFNSNIRNITSVAMLQTIAIRINYDSTKLTSGLSYGVNFAGGGAALVLSAEL